MLPLLTLSTALFDVRDIAADPSGGAWAATSGGLIALSEAGEVVAIDRSLRNAEAVRIVDGEPVVRVAGRWVGWNSAKGAWVGAPEGGVAQASEPGAMPVEVGSGVELSGAGRRVESGGREWTLPVVAREVLPLGDGVLVASAEGLWQLTPGEVARIEVGGLCGDFVTGITRWEGRLVVGTFDRGVCVQTPEGDWAPLAGPSPLVNEVLAVGSELFVGGSEGLVRYRGGEMQVVGEVPDEALRGAPGLNHTGVSHLAWDGKALWVADVLGPVRVGVREEGEPWRRFRFMVTGHSYQTVSACGGSVWAGSEDDGLAVQGVAIGAPNGRTGWRQVGALDGMPEEWVMATACAGPKAAWVGLYQRGVGRVDSTGWHPIAGLETAWVQALAVDGADLWVGTADGLYRVRDAAGAARVEQVLPDEVWSLLVERDAVWVGTRWGLLQVGREGAVAARAEVAR